MRILIASSELHPYSKTGGLADMVAALAKSLARRRHQVTVLTPLYGGLRNRFTGLERSSETLTVPLGGHRLSAGICRLRTREGVEICFLDHPGFFDRSGLYQQEGRDYVDNAERFIFFSRAVVALARKIPRPPEVVHLHDWQTGLVPLLLQHERRTAGWSQAPATMLTIHNLAYQGLFPAAKYGLTGLPSDYFNLQGPEFYGQLNCLKAGLCFADALTTVSPRYAREITTAEFGCGLDGVLRDRAGQLTGILNGVDYEEWKTVDNPHLEASYDRENLGGKAVNKAALQREYGLPERPEVPLFGSISRLADQKGVDLLLGALEEMVAADLQFVQLGSGDSELEAACRDLARRHPDKVAVRIGFNQGLSHRIEAGSDFFLMPSRFEPCGLNQMYSLRYGTVPVVRATGGLDDTVIDASEEEARADGIKFGPARIQALARAIRKALALHGSPEALAFYRRNGMGRDFGWEKTAKAYEEGYGKLGAGKGARAGGRPRRARPADRRALLKET